MKSSKPIQTDMITYKPSDEGIRVYLDGRRVGTIIGVVGGFAYRTKSGNLGATFPSTDAVKRSLESED